MTATKRSKVTKSKSEMVSAASKTKKMLKPVKTDPVEKKTKDTLSQAGNETANKADAVDLLERKEVTPVSKLDELEALIKEEGKKSYRSYLNVGKALFEIEKDKLYEGKYKNFVEYCSVRWGYAKSYGYDLVGAYKVYMNLSAAAEKAKLDNIFSNETQLRPFKKLKNPDDQVLVFNQLIEKSKDKPITAAIVKKEIDCYDIKTKTFSDKPIKKQSTLTPSTNKLSLKNADIKLTETGFSFTKPDDEKVTKFKARVSEALANGGSIEIILKPKKVKKTGKKKASAKNKTGK